MMNTPIAFKNWKKQIREVKAKRPKAALELYVASLLTTPKLAAGVQLRRRKGRVDVLMETNSVGKHFFPPAVKTVRLDARQLRGGKLDLERLAGYRPDHLGMRPIPERLPRELQVPRGWKREEGKKDDLGEPGTIFAPDTRYTFSDTSSPWCTCGRVQTASGWGSGVMIGPRHERLS